jgi:hypothetical protein
VSDARRVGLDGSCVCAETRDVEAEVRLCGDVARVVSDHSAA